MQEHKNIVYQETTTRENAITGETEERTEIRNVRVDIEPNFVKLYIQDMCLLNEIPKQNSTVLTELLLHVNYANEIMLPQGLKERIVDTLKISKGSLDNSLSLLVKKGLLQRLGRGVYKLNPYLFGKGKWQDIKEIRMEWIYAKYKNQTNKKLSKITIQENVVPNLFDYLEPNQELTA